jgi:hypothetical protein
MELGSPFSYTQEYIKACGKNAKDGWYWKIFTPNTYTDVPPNVEIVPMDCAKYAQLVQDKLGVTPNLYITQFGNPSMHVTDFYVYSGLVFEDYLKDSDFWGITNLDVVYGMLSHFIPDELLEMTDVFTDEINTINGVFCLWRNTKEVNNLVRFMPDWLNAFTRPVCTACVQRDGSPHKFVVTDEYVMTEVMKGRTGVRYRYPKYYPLHSHDRMEQHLPLPKLEWQDDGSLWELFEDVNHPVWQHAKPFLGREIPYFHFPKTKVWPKIKQK